MSSMSPDQVVALFSHFKYLKKKEKHSPVK